MAQDIQLLERKKMQLEVKVQAAEAELAEIDKKLVAEGIGPDTDVDKFLADLRTKRDESAKAFEEAYAHLDAELDAALECVNG